MDIISRNFFRLLRAGVFDQQEQIEPMSAWKWRQTFRIATAHNVEAMLYDGIKKCSGQFFLQLPDDLIADWQEAANRTEQKSRQVYAILTELLTTLSEQRLRPILIGTMAQTPLYSNPLHRLPSSADIFFPFETQGKKADQWAYDNGTDHEQPTSHSLTYKWRELQVTHHHRLQRMTNKLLNRTFQNLAQQEFRESSTAYIIVNGRRTETITPTLSMLIALMNTVQTMLAEGLQLQHLTDLGLQLRKVGDRVDFVKLQGWIEQLHMQRMAQLIGTHLTQLLGFTVDETPFMSPVEEASDVASAQGFLVSKQATARYYRYFPAEGVANIISSFTQSITRIEE
ncbi:MAG: nucleotidyltransferase family protein [Prevotella sp.]|nr:nucleotidyltransferase family protein [Prevotella sp.]